MYKWVTLLYSRNQHNVVNQLYFNKIKKNVMYEVSRWYIDCGDGCTALNTQTTELYVLKGWIVLYVNYASIKLLLKKKKKRRLGEVLGCWKHYYTLGTVLGADQDSKGRDGSSKAADQQFSRLAAPWTQLGNFYLNQLYWHNLYTTKASLLRI